MTKQAAHQKFAGNRANLKGEPDEVRAFKIAMRAGDATAAGDAERKRDALIAELKGAAAKRK